MDDEKICPCASDPGARCVGPWLHERSWHEGGADVPGWVVFVASLALAALLALVVLALASM
jgi:hypothetical protein